jgi:hypothetical protein
MTAPAPLAFPGSRTLAGWWRQLTRLQPRGLWVGHLFLHRVEALVCLARTAHPDPFHRLVLQALTLSPDAAVASLDDRLHLGRQVLGRVLSGLQSEGLAQSDPAGHWTPTSLGQQALQQGKYPHPIHERRLFAFVAGSNAGRPPQFLNLDAGGTPWSVPSGAEFDPAILQQCLNRSTEWKQQHGFPLDVQAFLLPTEAPGSDGNTLPGVSQPPSWQRVLLDRPERLLVVLVRVPAEETDRLQGYAVRQDGWVLQPDPAFTLGSDWPEMFPELTEEPPLEQWRQAWRMWCQPRGLAGVETDNCPLERVGHLLRAHVGGRALEKLRSARSDALKGEAWMLAGEGRIRTAAQLEITEASSEQP